MNMDKTNDRMPYEYLEAEKQRIRRIEDQVKSKPTTKDLKSAVSVLKDFGIKIDISEIPDCRSVFCLEQWKAKKIKEKLYKENL